MSRTKPTPRLGLPRSSDNGILIAGIAVFLALVAYLAVAFATASGSSVVVATVTTPRGRVTTTERRVGPAPSVAQLVGPWRARSSHLVRLGSKRGRRVAVRVSPLDRGLYGVEVQQLRLAPALRRGFVLSLVLRARRSGRLLVQINTGAFEPPIRYLLNKRVAVGRTWHRFVYHGRVAGRRTGLGLFVGQTTHTVAGRGFELRDLSVRAGRR
jgi:hypothetical protein